MENGTTETLRFVPITHLYSLSHLLSLFSSPIITIGLTIDHNYYDASYILVMAYADALL